MNVKTLTLLGGVFAVLVVAFLLVKPSRPEVTSGAGAKAGQALVKDFKPDEVRNVKLVKGDRTIQLAKQGDQWVVTSKGDRPADDGRVKSLLDAVRDAKVKEDRAGSKETFELDEKRRLSIQVSGADEKTLASIVAGKSPDLGTGFVLDGQGDAAKVLLVDQNFADKAQVSTENDKQLLSEDKWYDLKLLRITSEDVIDVAFQKGDQKWRIQKVIEGVGPVKPQSKDAEKKDAAKKDVTTTGTKAEEKKDAAKPEEKKDDAGAAKADEQKDAPKADEKKADETAKDEQKADEKKEEKKEEKKPVWRITEPQDAEANESECNSVTSALAWLDAKGYADEIKPEEQGFDKPEATTRVVLKDGTTHTIVFGKFVKNEKSESDSYATAKLDDKPQVWKVEKYAFENLTKALDKLKKEEPKKEEPKAEEKKDDAGAAKAEEKKDAPKAEEKVEPKKEEPQAEVKKDEKPAEQK
jgi:hypothetical protein